MALRTNRLYLIKIETRTVAIVSAKHPFKAIIKYVERTGFASDHRYLCCSLMTNTIAVDQTIFTGYSDCLVIKANTKTIGDDYLLKISSQQVRSCDGVFAQVDSTDIGNPLFMRPTIEEVRNSAGFGKEPMSEIRKFCR